MGVLSREPLFQTPVLSVSLLGTCIQGDCSLLLDLDNSEVLTVGPSNLKQLAFISCFIAFSVLISTY